MADRCQGCGKDLVVARAGFGNWTYCTTPHCSFGAYPLEDSLEKRAMIYPDTERQDWIRRAFHRWMTRHG